MALLGLSLFNAGCATEKYQAKPLDPLRISATFLNQDTTSPDFKAYLITQGYVEKDLPFTTWGLNELTLCALYHHTKLDVAKAQLALANAAVNTANQKQNSVFGGRAAHSNQANGDKSPWAFGLEVEIPFETGNKRAIRVEEAQHLAKAARFDVAEVAWQLRSQIAKDLLRYHENIALQQLLKSDVSTQDALIKMLEKRMQLGALSNTEFSQAKLLQQKTLFALNSEQVKSTEIRAALASDVGLSSEKFNPLILKPLDLDATLVQQAKLTNAPKSLQEKALLNRLDIRRSLEKYAAAEAKIKLEVAKQTPDIALNPGYLFEYGDRIWSLGFSSLLNLLNKNQTLIAEATNLREIEGAQFEALQTSIIGDLNSAYAIYQTSLQQVQQTQSQLFLQLKQQQRLQKQLDAGIADRLTITQSRLNYLLTEQQLLRLQFNCLNAANHIENLMQRPLFDDSKLNGAKPNAQSVELNP